MVNAFQMNAVVLGEHALIRGKILRCCGDLIGQFRQGCVNPLLRTDRKLQLFATRRSNLLPVLFRIEWDLLPRVFRLIRMLAGGRGMFLTLLFS